MGTTLKHSFPKTERLASKKLITELFNARNTLRVDPFKIVWIKTNLTSNTTPVQLAISVSKRSFKKAVIRNKLKRRIREAYRKNKQLLYQPLTKGNIQCAIMLIYIAKTELEYQEIESKIILTLQRLVSKISS